CCSYTASSTFIF
nr:immunoglobulin light chain junction region [Macaca mulatta]MPN65410.1 immunoglobulin light chain junction region [Macaca mulatta]MPN65437.1 immunoglobulin light chain junction region [Macaca mulatta]MPN65455.1 immunoglobulin light chain junction region [Macaca mulatta]MPN65540.1 immunoglobulin light chain junction region [Macaca mulatta]